MIQAIGTGASPAIDPNATAPAPALAPAQPPATTQPNSTGQQDGASASTSTSSHDNQSSTKVVVERGENQLVTVFKVLDRATGAVLTEVPHQAAQSVAADPNYTAGSLFNSKA